MDTVKVKPWGDGQGEFVLINKDDFDQKTHELFYQAEEPQGEQPAKRGRKPKQDDTVNTEPG